MAEQFPLRLPDRAAQDRVDFIIAAPNALAVAQVDGWRNWPEGKLVLVGPQGAGKSHLARIWAGDSGARILPATSLARADLPDLARAPVCVEDVPTLAGQPEAERALFHLHNLMKAGGKALLLTARRPPSQWPILLPDLASRMMGAAVARIGDPDDDLLAQVLAKLFHDRHTVPAPDVIPYLLRHMPRSYDMAGRVVAEIDARALATPGGATRAKARAALEALAPTRSGTSE